MKYVKSTFLILVICLIIAGIYIIYFKEQGSGQSSAVEGRRTEISRDINIGITNYDTINPILTKNLELSQITKLVYLPLIGITEDFRTTPLLAKQCAKIDELTYIVSLDEERKWADGSKVTYEDVFFTITKINEEDSIYKSNIKNIYGLEKIDENTFKIYLTEPTDFFEYYLTFPIMQEQTYDDEIPIGSGAYTISKVEKNKIIIEGDIVKITIKIYGNTTELYNNFTREKVDLIITQNPEYTEYIGTIGIIEETITGRDFYYINCENIKDINIRKYIESIINKEEINYKLYNNKYYIAKSPLEYGSYLNNEYEENKDVSTQNLKKKSLSISTTEETNEIAKIIKQQLQEKGIRVSLQNYYNPRADLIIKKEKITLTPDLRQYYKDKNIKEELDKIVKIENEEKLKQEYEVIEQKYNEEKPFISLLFSNYIILHSKDLKGNFSGNWYNLFYNIETWYKEA